MWLLTLLLWWLSRREGRPAAAREPQPPPVYKQQSRLVKQARRAAREGDLRTVKASLLEWGRLQWPTRPPRSIAEISGRVSEPLSAELQALGRASYGPGEIAWDGSQLDRALRSFSVSGETEPDAAEGLPPLMPSQAAR